MSRVGSPAPPARRLDGDGGAALVEFAFVAPIFFVLVFGILEFGLVFRDVLTVTDAVNDAARTGAIAGRGIKVLDDDPPPPSGDPVSIPGATPDFVTIKRLRQGLAAIPTESINKIVIFRAQDPTFGSAEDQLTQGCKDGVGSSGTRLNSNPDLSYIGACNVYDAEEAFRAYANKDTDYFNCEFNTSSPECNWPGIDRVNDPVNPIAAPFYSGPDYLGVYVEVQRPYLTGLFGTEFDYTEAVIIRLEPGVIRE